MFYATVTLHDSEYIREVKEHIHELVTARHEKMMKEKTKEGCQTYLRNA